MYHFIDKWKHYIDNEEEIQKFEYYYTINVPGQSLMLGVFKPLIAEQSLMLESNKMQSKVSMS